MVKERFQVYARLKPTGDCPSFPYDIKQQKPRKDGTSRMVLRLPTMINGISKTEVLDFGFHHVFDHSDRHDAESCAQGQEEVFERVAKNIVISALDGYNATVLCYGQTASGKTYTQMGGEAYDVRGIIQRSLELLFDHVNENATDDHQFEIHVCCIEVYNEVAYDMLSQVDIDDAGLENWPRVKANQDCNGVMHLSNMTVCNCESVDQAYDCLWISSTNRRISSTPMNDKSSRGHCIFTIQIKQMLRSPSGETKARFSKLHFVDLAGSERVHKTGYEMPKNILKEARHINTSLHFLHRVIRELHQQSRSKDANRYIPYRSSMLTSILRDSLGGNSKTVFIATLSTDNVHLEETISTLRFSQSCGRIENDVEVNEKALSRGGDGMVQELNDKVAVQNLKIQELMDEKTQMKDEIEKMRASPQAQPAPLSADGKPPLPPASSPTTSSVPTATIRLDHNNYFGANKNNEVADRNETKNNRIEIDLSTTSTRPHSYGYTLPILPPPPHLEGRKWSARELISSFCDANCEEKFSCPESLEDFLDVRVGSAAELALMMSKLLERVPVSGSPFDFSVSGSMLRESASNRSKTPPRPQAKNNNKQIHGQKELFATDPFQATGSDFSVSDLEDELEMDPSPYHGRRWIGNSPMTSLRNSSANINTNIDHMSLSIEKISLPNNDVVYEKPQTPTGPPPNGRFPRQHSRSHSSSQKSLRPDISVTSFASNLSLAEEAEKKLTEVHCEELKNVLTENQNEVEVAEVQNEGTEKVIIQPEQEVPEVLDPQETEKEEKTAEDVDDIVGRFLSNTNVLKRETQQMNVEEILAMQPAASSDEEPETSDEDDDREVETITISMKYEAEKSSPVPNSEETAKEIDNNNNNNNNNICTENISTKNIIETENSETVILGDDLPDPARNAWGSQEREEPPAALKRGFARDFLDDGTSCESTPVTQFSIPDFEGAGGKEHDGKKKKKQRAGWFGKVGT